MRRIVWLSFLVWLLPNIAYAEIKSVTLAGTERFSYNNVDKSGMYWDILNEIFTAKGITIEYKNLPYLIAEQEAANNKVDGAFVYPKPKQVASKLLYSESPMDHTTLMILFHKERYPDFKGMPDLDKKIIAMYKGYDFQSMITVPFTKNSYADLETGLKKLRDTYADFLIDYESDIKVASEAAFMDLSIFTMQPFLDFDVFFVTGDTPRGKEIMGIFNKGMQELVSTGKLQKIQDKWVVKKSVAKDN